MIARRLLVGFLAVLVLVGCAEPGAVVPVAAEAPQDAPQASVVAQGEVKTAYSVPLVFDKYDSAARTNMAVALAANGNDLRHEQVIKPGERWAWGEQLGSIDELLPKLQASNGVLGGGWSDLAARYANAWEALGLPTEYALSGRALIGLTAEQSPMLWLGEASGNADVVLVNNTDQTAYLTLSEEDGRLIVHARLGGGAG